MAPRNTTEVLLSYRDALAIDKHALDSELEEQPALYMDVCEQVVLAASKRDSSKDAMDRALSVASQAIRAEIQKLGVKMTESDIKEKASTNEDYVAAVSRYHEAKKDYDLWANMQSSFDMRGKMLRELGSLYIAGYWTLNSVAGGGGRVAKDVAAQKNREAMTEKRRAVARGDNRDS